MLIFLMLMELFQFVQPTSIPPTSTLALCKRLTNRPSIICVHWKPIWIWLWPKLTANSSRNNNKKEKQFSFHSLLSFSLKVKKKNKKTFLPSSFAKVFLFLLSQISFFFCYLYFLNFFMFLEADYFFVHK